MRGGARPGAGRKPKTQAATTVPPKNPAAHLEKFKWQPGFRPPGAGRPKGSRNKLGEEFLSALQADFEQHGEEAITEVRQTRPHEYLKVIAGILPKELKVTTGTVEELSDDELAAAIATLQSVLSAQSTNERGGTAEGEQPAPSVSTLQ